MPLDPVLVQLDPQGAVLERDMGQQQPSGLGQALRLMAAVNRDVAASWMVARREMIGSLAAALTNESASSCSSLGSYAAEASRWPTPTRQPEARRIGRRMYGLSRTRAASNSAHLRCSSGSVNGQLRS
jgi:hypothetical protein